MLENQETWNMESLILKVFSKNQTGIRCEYIFYSILYKIFMKFFLVFFSEFYF